MRAQQSKALLAAFGEVVFGTDAALKPLACLLLKKFYLDDRKEEAELEKITPEEVTNIKSVMWSTINIADEPMNLLRRKAEIICKLHKLEESYSELVQKISVWLSEQQTSDAVVKQKQLAMYMFELLSEYHLPQD
jgi:hypothetical protein